MAKYSGKIGFSERVETDPGIWEEVTNEYQYYGDLVRNISNYQNSGGVNDNININNSISIVANPYAIQNFQHIRYVTFLGNKWKVTNVEVQYPRLILTIGGLYNE